MPNIRVAQATDANSLAELAEATFRDAFAKQNTAENMQAYCADSFSEQIQANQIADPESVIFVVEYHSHLIAYAQVRWDKVPRCVHGSFPGEIVRIYVDQQWHGKGLAKPLMSACLNELIERQCGVAWLGVWEQNPRAIAFYKKLGFKAVGTQTFTLGTDPQQDIIMLRQMNEGIVNT